VVYPFWRPCPASGGVNRKDKEIKPSVFSESRASLGAPRYGTGKAVNKICVHLRASAVKFKMNNTALSDIVKVTAAILVKDNKIIIAKRGSNDRLANKWEFPGGKIEINETPEQCLKREMKEEFDIDVSVGEYLGSSIYHYDHISIELLAYRAYWENGEIDLKDHDDFKWISLEQLSEFDFAPADLVFVEKLQNGEIAIQPKS
jgi:8-oxo-dGTP diphosphatase